MVETGSRVQRYDIGAVISRAFETIGANFLLFCGLALILAGIPQFGIQYWQAFHISAQVNVNDGSYFFDRNYWSTILLGWLVSMIAGVILQSALTRATVMHLSGERPQFAQCFEVGIRLLPPMIVIAVLSFLGIMVGMLFLIVPGVVLWVVWSVVAPAYVQEKIGIFEAFSRSAALTKDARFSIFFTQIIMALLIWIVGIPLGYITGAFTMGGNLFLVALTGAATSALGSMVMVAGQASIYVELRQVKEGIAPSELEAIFA